VGTGARHSLAAIFTWSGRESAFIFCITLLRCAFTVILLMPSPLPTCLLSRLGRSTRFFVFEVDSELFDDALQVLDGRDFIAHRFIAMSSRFCRTSKSPGILDG
jgi:hypothetical protein